MLSYTEKVFGPGENPDFEAPAASQVVIPFGDEITISKMTIDRLWCYSPEMASWIKAEDISFNQSGRLYNGLAAQVIHLDEITWANVSSLADMGINPQAYKLKYHDNCPYTEPCHTVSLFEKEIECSIEDKCRNKIGGAPYEPEAQIPHGRTCDTRDPGWQIEHQYQSEGKKE